MKNFSSITGRLRRGYGQQLVALVGLLAGLAATTQAQAQTGGVGIGTTTPAASAALDVSSTTKGFLAPRLTTAQRDAIASPAAGLTIYNTTTNKLNTWNGTSWDAALSTTEQAFAGTAVTFNYTGASQTYTVPAGITSLTVDAAGAAGAVGDYGYSTGGRGARAQALLTVTPGEVLTIYVGGAGGANGTAGYNGGGAGSFDSGQGGGGGGASDVRRSATAPSTALAERLLVAAGGGGGGWASAGGGGGAPNGSNGLGSTGGQGATQTAGGNSGGALGQGGASSSRAGGGGGGYYGGGGGAFNSGGGGGSSWVTPAGSSGPVLTASYQAGDGVIVLTPRAYAAPVLDGSNFVNLPAGDNLGNHLATQNLNLNGNLLVGSGGSGIAIGNTGNVGIGNNNPQTTLDVQGNATQGIGVRSGATWDHLYMYHDAVTAVVRAGGADSGLALQVGNASSGTYGGQTYTDVMRLMPSGNVGIGTASPSQKLEVAGGIKFTGTSSVLTFPDGTTQATAATGGGAAVTASNGLTKTGNNIALGGTLTGATSIAQAGFSLGLTGGSVGIGTSSPAAKLTVQPASNAEVGLRVNNGVADGTAVSGNIVLQTLTGGDSGYSFLGFNGSNASGETRYGTSKNRWRLGTDQRSTGDVFFIDTYDGTASVSVLRATTAGNVGIGNNDPQAKLDVSVALATPAIGLRLNNSPWDHIYQYHTDALAVLRAGGANDGLALQVGNGTTGTYGGQTYTDVMRLTPSGNVGIGTATPAAKLDLQGGADSNGANDPGALAFSYRTGGYRHFVRSRHNGGTGGNALDFYLNNSASATGSSAPGTGNTQVLTLDNNSGPRVGIGTTSPSQALEVAGNVQISGTGNGLKFPDGTTQTTAATGGGTATNAILNQTTPQANANFNIGGNGTVGGTLTAADAVVTTALTGNGRDIGNAVGLGVRADGGLNIGQNTTGKNVLLGYAAGANTTGIDNQFVGYAAGSSTTSGRDNTFSGYATGNSNITGGYNTFEGSFSGNFNTGGNFNTFNGASSGVYNTTGSSNTALGYASGPANGSGNLSNATAIGANVSLVQSNSVVLGNGANVGIGTNTPATQLDVNGNLRLAVRQCPTNNPTPGLVFIMQASDIAFSIFKVATGAYVPGVQLPPAGTGQVEGQELTILNVSTTGPVLVKGANTDNTADVTLATAGTAGVHAVKYVWSGAWVRVQ